VVRSATTTNNKRAYSPTFLQRFFTGALPLQFHRWERQVQSWSSPRP
jgi:hypothetical protein